MTTSIPPVPITDASEALAVLPPDAPDLHVSRAPADVLAEARNAARALADVLDAKPHKVILNGEVYLEFEDWQTLGRFYGITAKIVETRYVEFAHLRGFDARAVAIRSDGAEISAAEASCMTDEPHWRSRPLFQLRSMAQTRACAKVLRNVLAWVVVLAGYKATPAEELVDQAPGPRSIPSPPPAPFADELDVAVVHVSDIRQKPTASGSPRFMIIASDRERYATFRRELAELAKGAKDAGTEVEIVYKTTKYGRDVVTLRGTGDRIRGALSHDDGAEPVL